MFELIRLPEVSEEKIDKLKYTNPWWDQKLKKLVIKQTKWLEKFKTNPDSFFSKDDLATKDYQSLFKNINHYLNFYQQKIKVIINNKKIFRKFQKMIFDCIEILALAHGIDLLMNYYLDLNHKEILNKKIHIIKLANNLTIKIYTSYKKDIEKLFPKDAKETLNQIYLNEKTIDLELFQPHLVFALIGKYINKLTSAKKIEPEKSLHLLYLSMVAANFINHYNFFVESLLQRIP